MKTVCSLRQRACCGREHAARASLEDAAQGTKRETGQQLRELQVEHGAALRQLAAAQESAQRMQQRLEVLLSVQCPRTSAQETELCCALSALHLTRVCSRVTAEGALIGGLGAG